MVRENMNMTIYFPPSHDIPTGCAFENILMTFGEIYCHIPIFPCHNCIIYFNSSLSPPSQNTREILTKASLRIWSNYRKLQKMTSFNQTKSLSKRLVMLATIVPRNAVRLVSSQINEEHTNYNVTTRRIQIAHSNARSFVVKLQ